MDIGTAKPTPAERTAVPFHLIDIVEPDYDFTLAEYQRLANEAACQIVAAGNTAILVGGTGLYFRAITTRLDIPETEPDPAFREAWYELARTEGAERVRKHLIEIDEPAANKIHPNDVRRMVRAIEVFEKTGTPLSEWHRANREAQENDEPAGDFYCLNCERNELYRTIERRVDLMVQSGFIDEVAALREMGYGPELKPMQALGYRQINEYLDGKLSRDDAIEATKAETRQFARRQLVWFRADKRLNWLETDGQTVTQLAERILASINKNKSIN
jgi:tRNA dimethylallyltransferase